MKRISIVVGFGALLVWALLADRSLRRPATSLMELEHNLLESGRLEVFVPEGPVRDRAAVLMGEFQEGAIQLCFGLPETDSFEDRSSARVIFGTTADPEILRLAEPLQLETTEGQRGFKIFGNAFHSPNDAVVFTRGDPDRPGLPLTVYAANEAMTLQNWLQNLEPCSRPGVRVFASGEPAFAAECTLSGRPLLETLFDQRSLRREAIRPGAARTLDVGEGIASLIVPPDFASEERLAAYSAQLERAFARVDELLPAPIRNRPALRIFVFDNTAQFEAAGGISARTARAAVSSSLTPGALGGGLAFARTNSVGRSVDVLLAPGLPDDGGAAAASLRAFDRAGPVASSWMDHGMSVHAAGSWWGRDLREWTIGFVPSSAQEASAFVQEAIRPSAHRTLSSHVVLPLRALVFERVAQAWSAAREGRTNWEGLWLNGAPEALISHAISEVAGELAALAKKHNAERSGEQRGVLTAGETFGLGWALEEEAPSYGSREATRVFTSAVEAGVNRVDFRSTLALERARPRFAAVRASYSFAPLEGDAALAGGLAAARAQGLRTSFSPELLLASSGVRFSERVRVKNGPAASEVWKQTFETYARFLQHYALLGELCDVSDLLIGARVRDFSQSLGDVSEGDDPEFESWLRSGWKSVIESTRAAFTGRLGYRADWPGEAHRAEFWDQLDFCDLIVDEGLIHPKFPNTRPHAGLISGKFTRWFQSMHAFAEERGLALIITAALPSSSSGWRDLRTPGGLEVDVREQEKLAESLAWSLRGLQEKGLGPEAVYLHGARTNPYAGGAEDRDFTVQNKPALDALRALTQR